MIMTDETLAPINPVVEAVTPINPVVEAVTPIADTVVAATDAVVNEVVAVADTNPVLKEVVSAAAPAAEQIVNTVEKASIADAAEVTKVVSSELVSGLAELEAKLVNLLHPQVIEADFKALFAKIRAAL